MTYSEDSRNKNEEAEVLLGDIEDHKDSDNEGESEDMNIDEPSPAIEIEIDIDDNDGQEEDEEDEDEGDDDDEDNQIEPFVEDNATESDAMSLDDMIIQYGEEEDDESESEQDDDDDPVSIDIDPDQPMQQDEDDDQDDDMDSEMASDVINQVNDGAVIDFMDDGEGDADELESPADEHHGHDAPDAFNVIEIDDNMNQYEVRANMLGEVFDDEDEMDEEDGMEPDGNDLGGFQHIMNLLNRNELGRPPINFLRGRDGNAGLVMGAGGARRNRRNEPIDPRRGLDSLYVGVNQERNENENELWDVQPNANLALNNRNRQNRVQEEILGSRERFQYLARDFERLRVDLQEIRDRISDRNYGMRGRARENERNEERIPTTNPFEVIR